MSCNLLYKRMINLFLRLALAFALSSSAALAQTALWHQDLPQAKVLGSGNLRWFGLHIYSAKLWSESATFDAKAKFALELTYQRNISRERFVDTSIDEIKRLRGDTIGAEVLQHWKMHMEKAFTDVKAGDQLIGVNLPKIGCRFYNRDKLLAEIKDAEFADAFFSIWFDPRSKDSGLRQQLTGAQK